MTLNIIATSKTTYEAAKLNTRIFGWMACETTKFIWNLKK